MAINMGAFNSHDLLKQLSSYWLEHRHIACIGLNATPAGLVSFPGNLLNNPFSPFIGFQEKPTEAFVWAEDK